MTDTVRTRAELVALFADNSSGDISPQDLRDFLASVLFENGTSELNVDPADAFILGSTDLGEMVFKVGVPSALTLSIAQNGLKFFGNSTFTIYAEDYPDQTHPKLSVNLNGVNTFGDDRTALSPTEDVYLGGVTASYWTGAATSGQDQLFDLLLRTFTTSPHNALVFQMTEDAFSTTIEVFLDATRRFYPDTDNTGSLGISGKTWGDIYATLPTSDPGNKGMWVNAANHNAVTIGSGA